MQLITNRRPAALTAVLIALLCGMPQPAAAQQIVSEAKIGYPTPAFPYYNFRADINLPQASMIEVHAFINGEKLRYVDLRDGIKPVDLDRPVINYRPPFADTYVANTVVYQKPYIVGWLPWQPGETYELKLRVRLKAGIQRDDEKDRILEQAVTLTAPADAQVFSPQWQHYKAVVLTETAGLDRVNEPVEMVLAFYAEDAKNLKNDLRVVAFDPETRQVTEVPSQAYDLKIDVPEEDPGIAPEGSIHPGVPIWVPTATAKIMFQANVPARTSRVFLAYYNNPSAEAPVYASNLSVKGPNPGIMIDADKKVVDKPGMTIENDKIKVVLHPLSGVLHELVLKSKPDVQLEHKMETNGAIHWIPEAYPPPRPWSHASDWKEPKFETWRGPVGFTALVQDTLPYVPEADAAVSYQIFHGQPYILTTSALRMKEVLPVQAMRNGEVVFKRGLLTHLAWFDIISNRVETVNLEELADLDQVLMDHEVPWVSFFNPETGVAFGGVQIEYANAGLEHLPRVLNPYFYSIVGPIVYWARAMNFTFASSASQHMVSAPAGSFFWEKWGLVMYEVGEGDDAHAPLIEWQKKLTNPLRVRLVEQVESRVPTVGTEIYIDPSRTGWEDRDTLLKD